MIVIDEGRGHKSARLQGDPENACSGQQPYKRQRGQIAIDADASVGGAFLLLVALVPGGRDVRRIPFVSDRLAIVSPTCASSCVIPKRRWHNSVPIMA